MMSVDKSYKNSAIIVHDSSKKALLTSVADNSKIVVKNWAQFD